MTRPSSPSRRVVGAPGDPVADRPGDARTVTLVRARSAVVTATRLRSIGVQRRQDFLVEGRIGGVPVTAARRGGRLLVDRPLRVRAELLVSLGERFDHPDSDRRFLASLRGPATVVALTCARACDRIEAISVVEGGKRISVRA